MAIHLYPGTINRIYYEGWKTTHAPICFVIYSGPTGNKCHCLYLNAKGVSTLDMIKFLSTIKILAKTNQKIHPRVLYRIFKQYNSNFVRNAYRTLFRSKIKQSAMISYGLADPKQISEINKSRQDLGLYNQAMKTLVANTVGFYLSDKKVKAEYFQPAINSANKVANPQQQKDARTFIVDKKNSTKTQIPTKTIGKNTGNFQKDVRGNTVNTSTATKTTISGKPTVGKNTGKFVNDARNVPTQNTVKTSVPKTVNNPPQTKTQGRFLDGY